MTKKRIKKYTHIVLLLVVTLSLQSYSVSAQYLYDFGFGGGIAGYTGEASNVPFARPGNDYGFFLRSNFNSRFSFRFGIEKGVLKGDTESVTVSYPVAQNVCDITFKTQFVNVEVLAEVNFFPFPFQKTVMNSSNISPYVFLGGGMTNYNIIEGIDTAALGKKPPVMLIPFGVGVKWLFGKQWGVQFQFKAAKMFADDFDSNDLDDPFEFGSGGVHRDDWLYTTTVMLTYSFGENIWDCNCPGGYKRKKKR